MSIKLRLESDLKEAMKKQDDLSKRVIRMALSAIRLAEVEKGASLDDSGIISVLHKEIKSRRESIADAERIERSDIIADAKAEIAILERYLPVALSEAELEEMARQAIREAGATSLREMGQVMKLLMPRLQGRATGDQASQVVRKLLS